MMCGFLNVAGREPEGRISKNDYEKVRDELIAGLKSIPAENGRPIGTMLFVQRNLARRSRSAPDLIVYFGALYWRSAGTVGGG